MARLAFTGLCPLIDFGPRLKRCSDCASWLSVGLFRRERGAIGARCRPCHNARQRERWNADKRRYHREWQRRHPDLRWDAALWYRYKITPADYDAILTRQGGGCAVCGAASERGRRLSVDHNHGCCPGKRSCGKCVRGLLCGDCNRAEGLLRSDPDLALKLNQYLLASAQVGLDL